jgi:hypothetical protein
MTNASQSWNKIADMISESHQVLEQGGLVDLTDLNQQVAIACESANSLTADERQQVLTQMQEVVAALDDLETLIKAQKDAVEGDLGGISRRGQAMNAYLKNSSTPPPAPANKNPETTD